jgi:opacity protein-like surface antigen
VTSPNLSFSGSRAPEFCGVEEILVKGKFLLFVFALLLPVSLVGQVARPTTSADAVSAFQRYEVFGGYAYSSANQVKGSSALSGFNVGASAKLKPWFGGVVDFGEYRFGSSSSLSTIPNVTTVLAGPEFYLPADRLTGFLHVMLGGAHTGNAGAIPDVSFAYAVGGGASYKLNTHWDFRISGDGISSSFVQAPSNAGFTPHARWNPRATVGVGYRF